MQQRNEDAYGNFFLLPFPLALHACETFAFTGLLKSRNLEWLVLPVLNIFGHPYSLQLQLRMATVVMSGWLVSQTLFRSKVCIAHYTLWLLFRCQG